MPAKLALFPPTTQKKGDPCEAASSLIQKILLSPIPGDRAHDLHDRASR
jgi:hypothetical protein